MTRIFCDLCNKVLTAPPAKAIKCVATLTRPGIEDYMPEQKLVTVPATLTVEGEFCNECKQLIIKQLKDEAIVRGLLTKKMGC